MIATDDSKLNLGNLLLSDNINFWYTNRSDIYYSRINKHSRMSSEFLMYFSIAKSSVSTQI